MLGEALGVEVRIQVATYPEIAERVARRAYGNGRPAFWFGWGPPVIEPDPSRYLLETYHSASGTAAAAGFASPAIDRALGSLRTRLDVNQRKEIVKQVQLDLLREASGGLIPWLLQRVEVARRKGFHAPPPTPFWAHHRSTEWTIESAERSFDDNSP
jgi:ABC-type transport system substrate-binding protein